jgi:hypothetical protein
MSPTTWSVLDEELTTNTRRQEGGKAIEGFSSIEVLGAKGPIQCIAAPSCPDGVVYCLDPSSWLLAHNAEAPVFIIQEDGLKIQRHASEDAFELRCASQVQLGCRAPGRNFVVKVTSS